MVQNGIGKVEITNIYSYNKEAPVWQIIMWI